MEYWRIARPIIPGFAAAPAGRGRRIPGRPRLVLRRLVLGLVLKTGRPARAGERKAGERLPFAGRQSAGADQRLQLEEHLRHLRIAVARTRRERPVDHPRQLASELARPQLPARQRLGLAVTGEARRPADEGGEEQRAERPDIGPFIPRSPLPLLGSAVGRGGRSGSGHAGRQVGEPEVEDAHPAVRPQQNAPRLQPPVDHAALVRRRESRGELSAEIDRILRRQRPALQAGVERLPLVPGHGEEPPPLLLAGLADRADPGMGQPRRLLDRRLRRRRRPALTGRADAQAD